MNRAFYDSRRSQGLTVEKKKCVYQKTDITDQQIAANIISNPVRALVDSGYFFFNEEKKEISVSPEIWNALERKHKAAITRICNQRLKDYFNE